MSHKIYEPEDIVLSVIGTEWHGKAKTCERIDDLTIRPILAPIVELELVGEFEGVTADMKGFQALAADLRERNLGLIPLGVHSKRYAKIGNSQIWEALKRALEGVPHRITNAGTLGRCRRFFISVQLTDDKGFKVGGDQFLCYLNFVTGHDGSQAPTFYDSSVRVVCQNTLNWSQNRRGNHWFKAKHTKGAQVELDMIADYFNFMLEGRQSLAQSLERAANTRVSTDDARKVLAGWQWDRLKVKPVKKFSTQSRNIIEGAFSAFEDGMGNEGRTRYDLINGVTEFYTLGRGAGSDRVTATQRGANARFGGAAKLKTEFTRAMFSETRYDELLTIGNDAVVLLN